MGYVKGEVLKKNSDFKSDVHGFIATVNAPAIPVEQSVRAMKELHRDSGAYRKRTDTALIKSAEYAKEFYSD